jgi:small subunit ribosomal protein S20
MPNIKSQEKRDRQGIKRALKNKVLKTRIKTNKKKLAEVVEGKDLEAAKTNLSLYFKSLDKAAKNSAVSKNFAANKKSKAAKLLNSLKEQ